MPRVIQRKTQTAEYWQDFTLTPSDITFLRTLLLDAERPATTQALAEAVVAERCRREETELRAELSRGVMYQPKKRFKTGEKVIFPALEFRLGEIIDVRPGQNPEFGEFEVISVDFGSDRRQRSFAAGLTAPHKLNVEAGDLLISGDVQPPAVLLETIAAHVPATLKRQLIQQPDFATFEDRWLLRGLLADIHVGHLNITEAAIEMRNAPVGTTEILAELDLPTEIKSDVLAFSLNSALAADGRFDQVGPGDKRQWFLTRLEPVEALALPEALRYAPVPYDRDAVPNDLLQMEWELDDENSDAVILEPAASRASLTSTTLSLTYPHLVSGTLPLNRHSLPFFPQGYGERTVVTLIDGRWGQRFTAWAVHSGRYIAGLRPWYEQHKLPAGAYIVLERRDNSGEIVVDFKPKRMRREWMRKAQVVDGLIDIQLRKGEVSCEYDELTIIGDERPEELVKLRTSPAFASRPLADIVYEIFVDLAGLSQSGTVHAKTIYSAVNLVRRCPPGPIFAIVTTDERIQSIGDGLYRLAV
jgi:hypothetical protein